MTPGTDLPTILACARELYGRAVYSHKTHEVERELSADVVFWMNVGNICLAAATTIAAVIAASLKPTWAMILTAVLAAASICFVIWQASFDPAGKEAQHRAAAKELLWIREQFLLLIAHCNASNLNVPDLQRSLDMLTLQITAAYKQVTRFTRSLGTASDLAAIFQAKDQNQFLSTVGSYRDMIKAIGNLPSWLRPESPLVAMRPSWEVAATLALAGIGRPVSYMTR